MISSRKTCICLMLVMVVAALTHGGNGGSASAGSPAMPAVAYARPINDAPSSGVAGESVVATNTAMVTPVRYRNGFFYQTEDDASVTEPALVIPGSEMDIEATAQAIEDLSIMARIIDKNVLAGYAPGPAVSAAPFLGAFSRQDAWPRVLFPSAGRTKPLYVGGYGAAFFIRVDFPLLPPPEQVREQPAGPQEDPVWAETRQSLFEPSAAQGAENKPEPYRREKVESLRRSLIASMKHAVNIRVLQPGEWLAVVVEGAGAPRERSRPDPYAGSALPAGGTVSLGRSVMTLRARKADIDPYAKGEIDQTQFEQRVQVITY